MPSEFNVYRPGPVHQLDGVFYEPRRILDHRKSAKGMTYLVDWRGFPVEDSSWEPEENLVGCEELIDDYFALLSMSDA